MAAFLLVVVCLLVVGRWVTTFLLAVACLGVVECMNIGLAVVVVSVVVVVTG